MGWRSKNKPIEHYFGNLKDNGQVMYFAKQEGLRKVPDFDAIKSTNDQSKCDAGAGWCVAGCTISALAIAASDGPAPIMDILAISYQTTCIAQCTITYNCE